MRFPIPLLLLLSGCVFLPVESMRVPQQPAPQSAGSQPAAPALEYREAVGVIHVHTTDSDGRLPVEAVARIAEQEGLDYLIVTDHNTMRGKREGKEGLRGKTRVLIGEEISTGSGHYLALRVKEEVKGRQEVQWTIDQVAAQGGLGFIAHPFWKKSLWKKPDARGFAGIEIYNAADDATDESLPQLVLWTLTLGSDLSIGHWLDRPDKSLEYWDRLLAEGKPVVGIGGADAHGLQLFGLRLAPYETVFKLVRNHLLVRGEITAESIYEALENGRLFVAHDLVADARGFRFRAVDSGGTVRAQMGERVRWEPGLVLKAELPFEGVLTLFKDGQPAGKREGIRVSFAVEGPGIYRLEVCRKGKPWIYTNPIVVLK